MLLRLTVPRDSRFAHGMKETEFPPDAVDDPKPKVRKAAPRVAYRWSLDFCDVDRSRMVEH